MCSCAAPYHLLKKEKKTKPKIKQNKKKQPINQTKKKPKPWCIILTLLRGRIGETPEQDSQFCSGFGWTALWTLYHLVENNKGSKLS